MNKQSPQSEYLVLSRGQWNKNASKEDIEAAIDKFYDWLARNMRSLGKDTHFEARSGTY